MPYYELRPKVNENLRLNVSGTSVAANGQNVTLYSATGSNDQIWFVQNVGATGQTILSAINQAYGLSANTSGTWNCCLYTTGGNPSTTTFEFEYVDGGCWRVKLLNQDRYLTCDGSTSGSNVSWKAKTGGDEQVWRFYPTFVNGPQNYAYMKAPWGTGKTIHIIRTAASNIKLVNLERKSLSGGKVYGMNGGFFDPAPSVNILNIAKCDGAYVGPNPAPYNGSNNCWCGNGVIYRRADGQMFFVEGQDALTESVLAPVKNLTGQGTWAQGGAGMYLGKTDWITPAEYGFKYKMSDARYGRTGLVVDNGQGFAYLIVNTDAEMSYIQFRQAIMTFFNLTDGATASTRYLGLFLDSGGSTQLRCLNPQNGSVNIGGGGALCEAITLRDT